MSEKNLSILGKEIKPGGRAIIEVEVAKLHTRDTLRIPVIVERSKVEGPIMLIMAGVHGDETNGVAIVREIIRRKYNRPTRGTIICIPVLNVFGYLNQAREFPDGRDLNRVFPGSKNGSLASQFAYHFKKEIAPLVDYVLDFHTGGAGRENYPNIRCVFSDKNSFDLAQLFGAPFILNSPNIPKSIRHTFNKMKKTILLFEGGKALDLDPFVINSGVEGALNILKHLGMQSGEISHTNKAIIIKKSKWLRAPNSGMFQPLVKNGSHVSQKELMGRISDPFGEFEKNIYAPFDSHVFGLNTAPIVYKGDALFHMSVEVE